MFKMKDSTPLEVAKIEAYTKMMDEDPDLNLRLSETLKGYFTKKASPQEPSAALKKENPLKIKTPAPLPRATKRVKTRKHLQSKSKNNELKSKDFVNNLNITEDAKGKFSCTWPGCLEVFDAAKKRRLHMDLKHLGKSRVQVLKFTVELTASLSTFRRTSLPVPSLLEIIQTIQLLVDTQQQCSHQEGC